MNDDVLRRRLHDLRAPEASASARERARHRALVAFQQGGSVSAEEPAPRGFDWSWCPALALALVVTLLPFLFFPRPNPENLADDRQILQQMEKLFPNQINAVVEENGKVDLSITESPVVGADQPVLVIFQQGRETIRVLSYSGHRVCLMLGQKKNCLEVLATPTGNVILEGDDKVWVASDHPEIAGYAVRAQTLEAPL
jgi:hypothetical protein